MSSLCKSSVMEDKKLPFDSFVGYEGQECCASCLACYKGSCICDPVVMEDILLLCMSLVGDVGYTVVV